MWRKFTKKKISLFIRFLLSNQIHSIHHHFHRENTKKIKFDKEKMNWFFVDGIYLSTKQKKKQKKLLWISCEETNMFSNVRKFEPIKIHTDGAAQQTNRLYNCTINQTSRKEKRNKKKWNTNCYNGRMTCRIANLNVGDVYSLYVFLAIDESH